MFLRNLRAINRVNMSLGPPFPRATIALRPSAAAARMFQNCTINGTFVPFMVQWEDSHHEPLLNILIFQIIQVKNSSKL